MKLNTTIIRKKLQAGFTLVELMVSIGIMVLIMSVVLINYGKFDTGIVLTNLAYDVGLSVRKAQTYGISVKGSTNGTDQDFNNSYGVHFDISDPTNYYIFVDSNGDGKYTSDEKIESYKLSATYKIGALNDQILGSVTKLDITFKRPNPDATVHITLGGVDQTTTNPVEIVLTSTKDLTTTKKVVVSTTGQISIPQN